MAATRVADELLGTHLRGYDSGPFVSTSVLYLVFLQAFLSQKYE